MADEQTLEQFAGSERPSQTANATPSLEQFAQSQLDEDKYGDILHQVAAGAAGLARGIAPGVSDYAAQKLGVSKEEIQKLQEVNPGISLAGQALGTAGLIYGTGGLAAPVAAGLEGVGIPSLAASVAGAGIEGAAISQTQNLSDLALGDPHVTAQKVLADAGMGLALGAGLGALGETIAPVVTEKLQGALDKIKSIASQPDAPGASRALIKNLGDAFDSSKQAAKDLYETAAPTNIRNALEASGLSADEGKAIGANVAGQLKEELPLLNTPSSRIVLDNRIEKLVTDLNEADSAYAAHKALSDFAVDVDKKKIIKFDKLMTGLQQEDQDILYKMRDTIRGTLKDSSLWGEEAANTYAETSGAYSEYINARKDFQRDFMKKTGSGDLVIDPGKVSTFFNNTSKVSQDLRHQHLQEFVSQAESLARRSENYAGYQEAEGAISKHISKLAEEQAQLKEVAEAMQAGKAGTSILGDLPLAAAAHMMGVPSPVVGAALGMHKAYKVLTNPYAQGSALKAVYEKLGAIGSISSKVGEQIEGQAKSIVRGGEIAAGARGVVEASPGSYDRNVKKLGMLADPNSLMNHMSNTTKGLHEAAPNVEQGLHSAMGKAAAFLNSKVPRPQSELPLEQPWEPSQSQKDKFNRYYAAVNNPLLALKQVKQGLLTNEMMESLNTVYPELLKEMRTAVSSHLDPKKALKMPYSTQIAVSKFLGQPMTTSLLPNVVMAGQSGYAQQAMAKQAAQGQTKSTSKGLSKLGGSKRIASRTTELEEEKV